MDEAKRVEKVDGAGMEDEAGRIRRAAEQARDALDHAREGLAAGASGIADVARRAVGETRERAEKVIEFVREAETDEHLKSSVARGTGSSLDRAGDMLIDSAPAIGRNVERAAEGLGHVLHRISGPLAAVLGAIAGTVGGWWRRAAQGEYSVSLDIETLCREHFEGSAAPTGMTFDRAWTGYSLGFIAQQNPEYHGRAFDEIEGDLSGGFERREEFDVLRDYARFGFERR
jgi:hypothetical protein